MPILTKFFGRTASEGAAFALGTATGPALAPAVRELVNEAWRTAPFMPLPLQLAAQVAAEDRSLEDFMRAEALKHGVAEDKMDHVLHALRGGPGLAVGFELWRRGIIGDDEFDRVLWEEKFEEVFHEPLKALKNVLLTPADLAMMRQQGFISRERQIEESARWGVNEERAEHLFEISGLPPGIETAMEMLRRGIIGEPEFAQIVREGHTKTKYTDELLQLRHPVLSATQAATLRLKGYITADESYRLGALTGYTAEQMDRLFLAQGRPMGPVQAFTAWARGAPGPTGGTFDRADFDQLVRESDIKPKYADSLWGIRYAYPSLFQLRRAVQDGSITPARARVILRYERYEDEDAAGLIAAWTSGDTGTQASSTKTTIVREYESRVLDRATALRLLLELGMLAAAAEAELDLADYRVVRSSLTAAQTKTRTLYVGWRITRLDASAELDSLGIPATAREQALATWDHERELNRPDLTPAQIATAAQRGIWTAQQAYDELLTRGYSDRDARVLLRLHKVTGP